MMISFSRERQHFSLRDRMKTLSNCLVARTVPILSSYLIFNFSKVTTLW